MKGAIIVYIIYCYLLRLFDPDTDDRWVYEGDRTLLLSLRKPKRIEQRNANYTFRDFSHFQPS